MERAAIVPLSFRLKLGEELDFVVDAERSSKVYPELLGITKGYLTAIIARGRCTSREGDRQCGLPAEHMVTYQAGRRGALTTKRLCRSCAHELQERFLGRGILNRWTVKPI